jgi:hypothetical protein
MANMITQQERFLQSFILKRLPDLKKSYGKNELVQSIPMLTPKIHSIESVPSYINDGQKMLIVYFSISGINMILMAEDGISKVGLHSPINKTSSSIVNFTHSSESSRMFQSILETA